jgi:hypothetical protein
MNVSFPRDTSVSKPLALVVLLENVGHIAGVQLPQWTMDTIDFVTEEYAKWLLRRLGAHQRYDRVVILEDEQVTGKEMTDTLIQTSLTHQVDQLLLVHGQQCSLVGYRGKAHVDGSVFDPLLRAYQENPRLLDLRMVYGLNCYGASLAPVWMQLGARAVNGAIGVNWLPEPSLSLFLRSWLNGASYSQAIAHSHSWAIQVGKCLWRDNPDGSDHPFIAGSRQIIYGQHDLTIHTVC